MNNKCEFCGKKCKRRWCSQACNAKSRRRYVVRTCRGCGSEFDAKCSEVEKGCAIYCSDKCRRHYEASNSKNYLKVGRKPIHRIVAEQKLGRKLRKGEVVHHIDGNILNNDPENLLVLASQSEHMKLEVSEGKRTISHEFAVYIGRLSVIARRAKKANSQDSSPNSG